MTDYIVTVKLIASLSDLIKEDKQGWRSIVGNKTFSTNSEKEALDEFHATVPIACLEHFKITIKTAAEHFDEMTSHANTVDGLIKDLQGLSKDGHGDNIIILSKDGEGNNFSPLSAEGCISWDMFYTPETSYYGEASSKDDVDSGYGYFVEEKSRKCVVLWPTN